MKSRRMVKDRDSYRDAQGGRERHADIHTDRKRHTETERETDRETEVIQRRFDLLTFTLSSVVDLCINI